MNFIRSIIPGNAHRLKVGEKSLDFSYITPRIVGMSYPESNLLNSLKHNSMADVIEYLNSHHKDNYLIFNVSGKPYDTKQFGFNVAEYNNWQDHHAPPFHEIFMVFHQALTYLKNNPKGIVIIHCLAGKGRTGTLICGLLLFTHMVKSVRQVINYYSIKRFKKINKGVQQPGQLRYVNYIARAVFEEGLVLRPLMFEIEQINLGGIILTGDSYKITKLVETNYYNENHPFRSKNGNPVVTGDFTINIYINNKLFAYLCLNAMFMNENEQRMMFNIKDIDPRELIKNENYAAMFIEIVYKKYTLQSNSNSMDINYIKKTDDIKIQEMIYKESEKIKDLNSIIGAVKAANPSVYEAENRQLIFGDGDNDVMAVLLENNCLY